MRAMPRCGGSLDIFVWCTLPSRKLGLRLGKEERRSGRDDGAFTQRQNGLVPF
ncbi:MAG: hypothetical protein PUI99_09585 [Clostridiales bacterium]|nr:hypothetical protein [Clostridiales bacterium]